MVTAAGSPPHLDPPPPRGREFLPDCYRKINASSASLRCQAPTWRRGEVPSNRWCDMAIASVIVATEAGAAKDVLARLIRLPDTNVYGSKGDEIVTVIEAGSAAALTAGLERLAAVDRVIGVYPVYAGDYE